MVLTHHTLRSRGVQHIPLQPDLYGGLQPASATGTGRVQEQRKAYLREIIERLTDLFSGDVSDQDKLVYVNDVLNGMLRGSETLVQQTASNSREQFANSADLKKGLVKALISALNAHTGVPRR